MKFLIINNKMLKINQNKFQYKTFKRKQNYLKKL